MIKNNPPVLSIIVPVYNVEDYVSDCLNSLISQTLKEIEIIIVNDGSTDSSMNIVNSFSDNRIKIINKNNGGLSSARNIGIKVARAEYIAFLDSDDWVEKNAYELLYNTAIKNKSDIVSCGFYIAHPDKTIKISLPEETNTNIKKNKKLLHNIKVAAWDKIYKKSLFTDNGIIYPEGLYYEDTPTTIPLIFMANSITTINNCLIYYRQRPGSITKEYHFSKKNFDIFIGAEIIYNFIYDKKINSPEIKELADYIFIKKCIIDTCLRLKKYDLLICYRDFVMTKFLEKRISPYNRLLSVKEKIFMFFILNLPAKIVNKALSFFI
ncbi:glycosyltransferase [Morganella morganii]|uniref:glycosyltransferase n=1 Tax=Morganella morganii TaxID=582 RepID=UPI00280F42BA|nr:glycosyltransferase [Morganella morganii]MDW7784449.1 glycosyltransferase [Morganella morganii]MDW7791656.1 glycosyltransferase [Morganella morganii]HDU8655915.1 glycosyltransferase [Morganella morganii subsp. morganii]